LQDEVFAKDEDQTVDPEDMKFWFDMPAAMQAEIEDTASSLTSIRGDDSGLILFVFSQNSTEHTLRVRDPPLS